MARDAARQANVVRILERTAESPLIRAKLGVFLSSTLESVMEYFYGIRFTR